MFRGEGYQVLVVFLYFVFKDIEFCVIYVLLNLLNFNLIGFRYHKKEKIMGKNLIGALSRINPH